MKKTETLILSAAIALILTSHAAAPAAHRRTGKDDHKKAVRISWCGHACFIIQEMGEGETILIDPHSKLDYPPIKTRPTIVLVSHEHFDHNNVAAAKGEPIVIRGLNEKDDWNAVDRFIGDVRITGVPSYHDASKGSERGKNTIFLIEIQRMRIVHLGDLGHPIEDEQAARLWPVDVLIAPVGGHFTLDPAEVLPAAERLDAKILIPMHYKTKYTGDLPIKPVADFLKGKSGVKELTGAEYTIFRSSLPEKLQITVFKMK